MSLYRARVSHLVLCYPEETAKSFQDNLGQLSRDVLDVVRRAQAHGAKLEEHSTLASDQIQEIMVEMVAPSGVPPAAEPMDEELADKIMEWSRNPVDREGMLKRLRWMKKKCEEELERRTLLKSEPIEVNTFPLSQRAKGFLDKPDPTGVYILQLIEQECKEGTVGLPKEQMETFLKMLHPRNMDMDMWHDLGLDGVELTDDPRCLVYGILDELDAWMTENVEGYSNVAKDRSQLDQLLSESKLYTQSKDYKNLLEFVVRLRDFAPFNAMLLQVQKPGLSYAASATDWWDRFRRRPKEGARPLIILLPFGPVGLVYDVLDTEGKPLPADVAQFSASGDVDEMALKTFATMLASKNIEYCPVDEGDRSAGAIRVVHRAISDKETTRYRIKINRNHEPAIQFGTLAHELAHLFLGHLGPDQKLKIRDRYGLSHAETEIEAESVAYIVCGRNGVALKSQTYLSSFVSTDTTTDTLDVYQIMKAAGQIETLLKLSRH